MSTDAKAQHSTEDRERRFVRAIMAEEYSWFSDCLPDSQAPPARDAIPRRRAFLSSDSETRSRKLSFPAASSSIGCAGAIIPPRCWRKIAIALNERGKSKGQLAPLFRQSRDCHGARTSIATNAQPPGRPRGFSAGEDHRSGLSSCFRAQYHKASSTRLLTPILS
jgi:hypothetical protein